MRSHRPIGGGGSTGRLATVGPYFVDGAGAIVIRKSITAFCAPKRFAEGRGDEALRFLDYVAGVGLEEIRVFTRVDWTGPPGPGVESGWQYDEAASTRTIREAAARGIRVELVAHTGKYGTPRDMADHLRRVDELAAAHPSAILEVYNEPQQNGGHELVDQLLELYTPRSPGWSSGVYDPTPYTPGGRVGLSVSYHSPRKSEWSRCFKDAYEYQTGQGPNQPFAPGWPGPVMLDEPPQVEQTIRDQTGTPAAEDWEAYGAGAALFACGATMHGNPDFQQCRIPTSPAVLEAVARFVRGLNTPPRQRYHGYYRGDPPGSDPGSRRYFRWGDDGAQYEITVRPYSFRRV